MELIIFAVIWLLISNIIILPIELHEPQVFLVALLLLFNISGIYLLCEGVVQVIKNYKTKKYGIKCYGKITEIKRTGVIMNEAPQLKAIIKFVNSNTNQLEKSECNIGYSPYKYPIGSCVLCKYYDGTIVFEKIISENNIPEEIRKKINTNKSIPRKLYIEYRNNKEYVIIDGVRYKKVKN